MSPQVDSGIRNENFAKLSPLLLSNSNTILTCRPSYFISKTEYDKAVSKIMANYHPLEINDIRNNKKYLQGSIYKNIVKKYSEDNTIQTESRKVGAKNTTIKISDFSEQQIDAYLTKFNNEFKNRCHSSWEEVREFLVNIYDIKSLLKKPILLSMIKDTMLELGINYDKNNELYDPASLYEIYTKANIARDISKGKTRQYLTDKQRLKFAQILAHQMLINDRLEVNYNELAKLVENNLSLFKDIEDVSIDKIASDIQICSFITLTEDETFRFIHKSFMEFFIAQKFKKELRNKEKNELYTNLITREVLYFLGCYSNVDEVLKNRFKSLAYRKNKTSVNRILQRNTTIALLLSNSEHIHLSFKNIYIDFISLDNIKFKHSDFENVNMNKANLINITFTWSSKLDLKIESSNLDSVLFEESQIAIKLKTSSFSNIRFKKCKSIDLSGDNIIINKATFEYCESVKLNAQNSIALSQKSLFESNLTCASKKVNIESTKLITSTLVIENQNDFLISKSQIENSSIFIKQQSQDAIVKIRLLESKVNKVTFKNKFIRLIGNNSIFKNCVFSVVILRTENEKLDDVLEQFIGCSGLIILENQDLKIDYYRSKDLLIVSKIKSDGYISTLIRKKKKKEKTDANKELSLKPNKNP